MLMPSFEKIYKDSMIAEDLYDVVDHFSCTELVQGIALWEKASASLEELIPRVAQADINQSKELLDCWKKTLVDHEDFRVFSMDIQEILIPAVKESINCLYAPICMNGEKWTFEKTPSGFLTVKDVLRNRYLHSPYDPMREASVFADKLYDVGMSEYHILGCGLAYLPYQIWIKSHKSAHIYVYDDDREMLEYAEQIGLLSWIDKSMLTVVCADEDSLLDMFCNRCGSCPKQTYISDWKLGGYYTGRKSEALENIDFDMRTVRVQGEIWSINERENRKRALLDVNDFLSHNKFRSEECLIVAAGPSLDDCIDFIRESKGNKTIIAVNTALKRLHEEKIIPDIATMLSPPAHLVSHIEGIEDFTEGIPLIAPLCASRTFVSAYRGPVYLLDEKELSDPNNWCFNGTVTSLALSVAYYLNASSIYLIGCDLAFSGGRNYSRGTAHGEYVGINNDVMVESTDGGMVKTKQLYNAYRGFIEEQIAAHPKTRVYNLAKHGAKIAGTIKYDV